MKWRISCPSPALQRLCMIAAEVLLRDVRSESLVNDASRFGAALPLRAKLKYHFVQFFSRTLKKTQDLFENRLGLDRSIDDDTENHVATTTTPKRRKKWCENSPKQFENCWKRLENRTNKFWKVYVFGCGHCFRLFWNFRMNKEFDTLILHMSVHWLHGQRVEGTHEWLTRIKTIFSVGFKQF